MSEGVRYVFEWTDPNLQARWLHGRPSRAHAYFGEGFGSSDPNLDIAASWWVWVDRPKPCGMVRIGRPSPTLHELESFGRRTQTLGTGGAWASRPSLPYAGWFGSTDPNLRDWWCLGV